MITDPSILRRIIELGNELNRIQDIDIMLERILLAARQAVNADAGSIYVREGDELVIRFAQNDTKQHELPPGRKLIYSIFRVPVNQESISGYAAKTSTSVSIADVYNIPASAPYRFDPRYDQEAGYRTRSSLTVPLVTNMDETIGVLQIINAQDTTGQIRPFNEDDELFVSHFAVSATLGLQRAEITRSIILRMIAMAEMRDPRETGPHVNRVAAFATEIYEQWATRRGTSHNEIERTCDLLRMAAMLHDVGKVAVSDAVLKKPGPFTPEEFKVMSAHTYLGARLFVDRQSPIDELAADVALMHHENWDGTGYPGVVDLDTGRPINTDGSGRARGRKGEEISIWGRIVAVADVFDALTSARVYKEAWTVEDALREMQLLRGTKFDPEIVDIFFEILPNIKQIARRYAEADGAHRHG